MLLTTRKYIVFGVICQLCIFYHVNLAPINLFLLATLFITFYQIKGNQEGLFQTQSEKNSSNFLSPTIYIFGQSAGGKCTWWVWGAARDIKSGIYCRQR